MCVFANIDYFNNVLTAYRATEANRYCKHCRYATLLRRRPHEYHLCRRISIIPIIGRVRPELPVTTPLFVRLFVGISRRLDVLPCVLHMNECTPHECVAVFEQQIVSGKRQSHLSASPYSIRPNDICIGNLHIKRCVF